MTEALWGVVIGGAVGVVGGMIGPIVQHHYAGKRWKKKAALDHLQRERDRMEKKFFDFEKRVKWFALSGEPGSKADAVELLAFITLYLPKILLASEIVAIHEMRRRNIFEAVILE